MTGPSPFNLGGLSLLELGRRVWRELVEDEVADRGAALAYYFLFALFPTLLFLTVLLGMSPLPGLLDHLVAYADKALPPAAAAMVERTIHDIRSGARSGLLSVGALAALWAGSNGMASIMTSLNIAYDIKDRRSWWKRRALAILMTIGFGLLIVLALVLLVFGPLVGETMAARLGLGHLFWLAWRILNVPVAALCALAGIALVYYLAPAVEQRWRWVTPGSGVALVLWLAMSFGLRQYVGRFATYTATYGSIGGVILLMLWLYLTGVVLLVGAEINSEIEHAAAMRGEETAKAPGERESPADRDETAATPVHHAA